jgi:hypothetical protein
MFTSTKLGISSILAQGTQNKLHFESKTEKQHIKKGPEGPFLIRFYRIIF